LLPLRGLFSAVSICALLLPGTTWAQSAPELPTPQQSQEGGAHIQQDSTQQQGMATGVAQGAQFDAQHRPITAGG